MMTRIKRVLAQAGVAEEQWDDLARLVLAPPPGTIDETELAGANDGLLALLVALVAATKTRQFGDALRALLAFVGTEQAELSDVDNGRFWHLTGVAAWRLGPLDQTLYAALRALNHSVAWLEGSATPQAQAYLARVFDTSGQLLQHRGLLREARAELERALCLREAAHDRVGEGWTLGSLGRLCMELGDFAAAAVYLARDLAIVEQLSPEQTWVRTQLLSHLGTCAVEQGDSAGAQQYFHRSDALARADHNRYGRAFAALGLGRVALQGGDLVQAEQRVQEASTHMASSGLSSDDQEGIRAGIHGLLHQLQAEIHLARGDARQAVEAFAVAAACFQQTPRASMLERAALLYGYARARLAHGEDHQAAALLRQTLRLLDASTAEPLRQQVEAMVRTHFPELWLLHTTGRFIGQQYMDFLLEHAGQSAFRGDRQDVVMLFSDLRDFTTIFEQCAPQPEKFVTVLNDYLGHMTRCVDHYGGIVCQFNGDGILAAFSLPEPHPTNADQAVQAALMMQEELTWFCRTLPQDIPRLVAGVGLHAGPVTAGLFGSPQKRVYTVNGDAVNTTARIESLTKRLGASILISAEVVQRLSNRDSLLLRPLGRYSLKGKAEAIEVVDVMGEDDGSRGAQALRAEIAQVCEALKYFQCREFLTAGRAFAALATTAMHAGHPHRAQGYRCLATIASTYRNAPPPTRWDGAITL